MRTLKQRAHQRRRQHSPPPHRRHGGGRLPALLVIAATSSSGPCAAAPWLRRCVEGTARCRPWGMTMQLYAWAGRPCTPRQRLGPMLMMVHALGGRHRTELLV